jgi:hypothetical protein
LRLDAEATPEIKRARLHRKVATAVFFESNGGQQRGKDATQPEIRLAVAEPGLDIGNVEQCLEALVDRCYYLTADKNRYRFSFTENLNKRFADVRATVGGPMIDETVRAEVQKAFGKMNGVELVPFPRKSGDVQDRPVLMLVIMPPEQSAAEAKTVGQITSMTSECGSSSRTYKSAVIWVVAEESASLRDEARRVLAWREIREDSDDSRLDEIQLRQLKENVSRAERDLRECAWRTYKNVFILGADNALQRVDLGLIHSSQSTSMTELIVSRLREGDVVVEGVAPTMLTRYWPPALPEWSTKSVRDAFFASPRFPRLLKADSVKDTISRGLDGRLLAYVGKTPDGRYEPLVFGRSLPASDIEISDDVFLITRERAEAYLAEQETRRKGEEVHPPASDVTPPPPTVPPVGDLLDIPPVAGKTGVVGFSWSGDVPHQKWMNFYTKVLSRFANGGGLRIAVTVDVAPAAGVSRAALEETRSALRDLGASEDVKTKD